MVLNLRLLSLLALSMCARCYLRSSAFPHVIKHTGSLKVESPTVPRRDDGVAQHLAASVPILGAVSKGVIPVITLVKATLISAIVKLGFMKSADTFIPIHIDFGPKTFGIIAGIICFIEFVRENNSSPYDEDGEEIVYNVNRSEKFYKLRPHLVLRRLFKIFLLATSFNFHLLMDWQTGKLKKNEDKRAKEAMRMLTLMGPTFIKLGQALSIRTDLISPSYAKAFRQLQDAVPAFDSVLAKRIVCRELGITHLSDQFRTFSSEPVAAASIGQVYRATLLDGRDVAVKVQRPNILASIGLDLFVMRQIVPLQVKISNAISGAKTMPADIELGYSLVDEWGKGLVSETEYRQEACNTMQFNKAMQSRGLHAVMSPAVVEECSTSRVLVTQWIDGTRLDRDSSADVPRLCGIALNAYLTMLLDTGVLHCDPHPGNLLRTKDGRLCILDWGMTISLPQDLQYSLLEFIAHCNAEDFTNLPEDFVNLGATPADKVEAVRCSGIPEGFAFIMRQLSKGGGPAQLTERLRNEFKVKYGDLSDTELSLKAREDMIRDPVLDASMGEMTGDVNGVTGVLEMMSKRNREIFKLPAYMLYITRAFTTLEGIGLSVDKNYAILNECYPYLAKRLMTDDSPRSRKALRGMLYRQDGKLNPDKILEFSEGFTSYTASTADADKDGAGTRVAQEALTDLLLSSEGNLMQEVLLDGAAQMADSLARVGVHRMRHSPPGRLLKALLKSPKTLVDMTVPDSLKLLALPLTLPYDVSKAFINLAEVDETDEINVRSVGLVRRQLQPKVEGRVRDIVLDGTVGRGRRRRQRRADRAALKAARTPGVVTDTVVIDSGTPSSGTNSSTSTSSSAGTSRETFQPLSNPQEQQQQQKPRSRRSLVPLSLAEGLGSAGRLPRRLPVILRLSRRLAANCLSTSASRLRRSREQYHELAVARHSVAQDPTTQDVDDSIDYEVELLATETVGAVSASAASAFARILDRSKRHFVPPEGN